MRIETVHPAELGAGEITRWRALQADVAGLESPYLAPEWAQAIGAVRPDARVCVIEGGAGFFGAQRLSRFAAMGLGAPIADYQGLVAAPGLDVRAGALCKALRVGRLDLTHVPAGQTLLAGAVSAAEGSWIAETGGGRELYEAGLKARRSEFARQTDKKLRKLARDHGETAFSVSQHRADFEALLTWKRQQLRQTGQPAIWDTPWVRQTIDRFFAEPDAPVGGLLFTLRAGGKLAAANFCLRGAGVLHMWIIGHDDTFDAYSPGVQLARWAIGWAGDSGMKHVDFGPGDYRYKRQLATGERQLEWGVGAGVSFSGAMRRAAYGVRAGVERLPSPRLAALPGKAMRKLDLMRALAA